MEIRICKDSKALGKSAAAHVAQVLRDCIAEQGYARIVLSTGASNFLQTFDWQMHTPSFFENTFSSTEASSSAYFLIFEARLSNG